MEEKKSVKALKKQLMAAIAMVCVAAIALGASTYAWFVSNNKVDATTTNISAQSNSAYLVIEAGSQTTTNSKTSATGTEKTHGDDTALYPAQWKNNFNAEGTKVEANGVYQFESAYASTPDAATEKSGTRFKVGNPTTAVEQDYALLNTFYIGSGTYDGEFQNLTVSNMTVTETGTTGLKTGMRLLIMAYAPNKGEGGTVTYGDTATSWVVAKYNDGQTATIESQSNGKTDGIVYTPKFGKSEGDVKVEVYAYYDGADDNVKTTNLINLKDCGATVTFNATPDEFGKQTN